MNRFTFDSSTRKIVNLFYASRDPFVVESYKQNVLGLLKEYET